MNTNPWLKRFVWLLVFGCLVVCFWLFPLDVSASPAFQSVPPPPNDNFADAASVEELPFNAVVNIGGATLESNEPLGCYSISKSVWYRYTPSTDTVLLLDTRGSTFDDTVFNVYQGTALDGLSLLNCAQWGAPAKITAYAGQTYYIQAGRLYWYDSGGLHLNIVEVLPPPNDYFADAEAVTALPFSSTEDNTLATMEDDEPTPGCGWGTFSRTIWYAYTPSVSGPVTAYAGWDWADYAMAVYTGDSLTSLTGLGCRVTYGHFTFAAQAGTTYHFQVAAMGNNQSGGGVNFFLEVTPPPQANFYTSPSDPSIFDTVQFYDSSWDPGEAGIQSHTWDFGDGAISSDWNPTHQYRADGDYTVTLKVTTTDGRTASATQVVSVRTHDVAIVKVGVPTSARTLQTKQVSVGVNSRYYNENVLVELYKSTYGMPDNFEKVGESRQLVRAQGPNKSTQFVFNYTFTAADAQAGTVTFKAVSTIVDRRDVQPANNMYISLPVKVSGGKLSGANVEEEGILLFLPAIAGD